MFWPRFFCLAPSDVKMFFQENSQFAPVIRIRIIYTPQPDRKTTEDFVWFTLTSLSCINKLNITPNYCFTVSKYTIKCSVCLLATMLCFRLTHSNRKFVNFVQFSTRITMIVAKRKTIHDSIAHTLKTRHSQQYRFE